MKQRKNQSATKNKIKILMTHQSNIVHFDHTARLTISNHDGEILLNECTPCLPQCPLRIALGQSTKTTPRCQLRSSIGELNHHPLHTRNSHSWHFISFHWGIDNFSKTKKFDNARMAETHHHGHFKITQHGECYFAHATT